MASKKTAKSKAANKKAAAVAALPADQRVRVDARANDETDSQGRHAQPHPTGPDRKKITHAYLDSRRLLNYLGKPPQAPTERKKKADPPAGVLDKLEEVLDCKKGHARKVFNGETALKLELFTKLDDELDTSGHYFRKRTPHEVRYNDARLAFAERLETLIIEGTIPKHYPDPETGEPVETDVVRYSWHLRDGVLANIAITHNHQRDAFRLLVDWDLLVEKKADVYAQGLKPTVGRMVIARPSLTMLLHEVDVREVVELKALGLLETEDYCLLQAQELFPERFEAYCGISQWKTQDEVKNDDKFLEKVPIKQATDLDLDVRRVIISTGGSEASLRSLYRESRYAIVSKQRMMTTKTKAQFINRFPAWWRQNYFENKRDLEALGEALGAPGKEANFDRLKDLIKQNNQNTRELLKEHFREQGVVGSGGDKV